MSGQLSHLLPTSDGRVSLYGLAFVGVPFGGSNLTSLSGDESGLYSKTDLRKASGLRGTGRDHIGPTSVKVAHSVLPNRSRTAAVPKACASLVFPYHTRTALHFLLCKARTAIARSGPDSLRKPSQHCLIHFLYEAGTLTATAPDFASKAEHTRRQTFRKGSWLPCPPACLALHRLYTSGPQGRRRQGCVCVWGGVMQEQRVDS